MTVRAETDITLARIDDGANGANIWTATANATTPNYTFEISALTGGTGTPKVGDIVLRSYYRYTISSVGATTVLTGNRTSIRGATGATGATGKGISSVVTEYYLSSSSSSATGGSWGTSVPAYVNGYYYWTRDHITYTDGTDDYSPSSAGVYNQAVTSMNVNAYNANQVANATKQYFWTDANGAHISTTADDPAGSQNALWNSSGLLFRSGSNNLLALLPSVPSVVMYDGAGNNASNELASFGTANVSLAKGKAVLKYSEDGSAFGIPDSHRVVLAKGENESNVRNDATLSSMQISSWDANKPMSFFNATHKTTSSIKYSQAGLYAWGGEGGLSGAAPSFVILQRGTADSDGSLLTGDVNPGLYMKAPKVVINGSDWTNVKTTADTASATATDAYNLAIAAVYPASFVVEEHSIFTSTNISGGSSTNNTKAVTKTGGYYPIGIVGFTLSSAYLSMVEFYLTSQQSGQATVNYKVKNFASNTASGASLKAYVLWVKE